MAKTSFIIFSALCSTFVLTRAEFDVNLRTSQNEDANDVAHLNDKDSSDTADEIAIKHYN